MSFFFLKVYFREENDAIIKSGSDIFERHKNIVDKKSVKAYSVLTYIVHMIRIVHIRYGHAFVESNDKQTIKQIINNYKLIKKNKS